MTKQGSGSLSNQHISKEVLGLIEKSVQDISFGSITLVIQDSRVIQIDRLEKIRIADLPVKAVPEKVAVGIQPRILQAVSGMEYGKVVIQIQAGQLMQVERTEKYRVGKLTGLNGDGI